MPEPPVIGANGNVITYQGLIKWEDLSEGFVLGGKMTDTRELENQLSVRSDPWSRDAVTALREQRERIDDVEHSRKRLEVEVEECHRDIQRMVERMVPRHYFDTAIDQRDAAEKRLKEIESAENEQCKRVAEDLEKLKFELDVSEKVAASHLEHAKKLQARVMELKEKCAYWVEMAKTQADAKYTAQQRVEELEAEYSHAAQTLLNRCEACDTAEKRLRDVAALIAKLDAPGPTQRAIVEQLMAACGFVRNENGEWVEK